jgi:hypothetical protein
MVSQMQHCHMAMERPVLTGNRFFIMLIKTGFEVYFVNSKQMDNISKRKNDADNATRIKKFPGATVSFTFN